MVQPGRRYASGPGRRPGFGPAAYNVGMQPWWQQPFFQVALPIIITFALTFWAHNRRIDDLNRRIDDLKEALTKRLDAIERRLERIEQLLAAHDRRITTLEERTSPLRR